MNAIKREVIPLTKLSKLRAAAAENQWQTAVAIAAKFPRLGDEKSAIMSAHEAYVRPEFQRQLGRDIDKLKAEGIAAIKRKYDV